ncbi:alpha/beta hydrolase domain-containing protein [Pseudomonas sp. FP2335]|uniref:alpha/beta hydrolase domain-containing protein n=1 Tax=Pseudomonas sp. FP2335 TaxID=2954092 RepID=UPI00273653A9|nr:alpha/beta hydrolase domain-containing protein [Pseudomonas sp. FP2335]WLH81702.1 alpha/beta hydrolase domain-containing protein [Pseudomonas sp. FP2335]
MQRTMTLGGLLLALTSNAWADVPRLPTAIAVPPSGQLPLSSALHPGTEYSDLDQYGYTEQEFYLQGIAPAITATGEQRFDAPYTTRILVRRPADSARFNGTVVIEPFSWFGERGAGWILTRDYLLRRGYAYVGYTLNTNQPRVDPKFIADTPAAEAEQIARYGRIVNFDFMRRFDYARYAPLGTYYDPEHFSRGTVPDPFAPQSQGIAAQLALLLKTPATQGPLAGFDVQRVYVNSWAVTAQVWMDYLDQGRHQQWRLPDGRPLIDAYMTGRMAYGEVGGDVIRVPRQMPEGVPFVTVYSQSETLHDVIEGIPLPPDTDSPQLRYYEVTGMPHLRLADLGTEHTEPLAADVGKGDDPRCQTLYDEPVELVVSALLDRMDRWVRDGTPMPKAPRVVRDGKAAARAPATGNLQGGVRPPWVQVPSATYLTDQETGCGLIYDTKVAYAKDVLGRHYANFNRYAQKFEEAKAVSIQQGYLLPEDAARLRPIATPQDF